MTSKGTKIINSFVWISYQDPCNLSDSYCLLFGCEKSLAVFHENEFLWCVLLTLPCAYFRVTRYIRVLHFYKGTILGPLWNWIVCHGWVEWTMSCSAFIVFWEHYNRWTEYTTDSTSSRKLGKTDLSLLCIWEHQFHNIMVSQGGHNWQDRMDDT